MTAYIQSAPEIEQILNKKNTRSHHNTLLRNGNLSTPLRLSKEKYIIYNTCPFDSISFIISMAYIDHPQYKQYIDSCNNHLLKFCKDLAINGSSKITYKNLLELHQTIFEEVDGVTGVKIIDGKCNITHIITNFLRTAPSAIHQRTCSYVDCTILKKDLNSATIVLDKILVFDFINLNQAIKTYTQPKYKNCTELLCYGTTAVLQHLIFETDVFAEDKLFLLKDFPLELSFDNKR